MIVTSDPRNYEERRQRFAAHGMELRLVSKEEGQAIWNKRLAEILEKQVAANG